MTRISWERLAALAGFGFVALFVVAFSLGIEVGPSDREILDHYADGGSRTLEAVAFFLIAAAALCFVVFAGALRSLIARADESSILVALAGAGGIACGTLLLAGNAVSRAAAFAAMSDEFALDADTRRYFEDAGLLLLASGAMAAMLLVVAVSLATLRSGVLPRWLGWAGFPAAALLPLAIAFLGFLVLALWMLTVSVALFRRGGSKEMPVVAPDA